MDSPFPGMDPHLERFWGDVHQRLVTYACDQIQPALPPDLRARMQQRVLIGPPDDPEPDVIVPDVHVAEPRLRPGRRRDEGGGVAVAEPVEVETEIAVPVVVHLEEQPAEGYIEIVEAGARDRVVTVIEVLSPSNKRPGRDREAYERKRRQLADGGVSLVEIDLLRGGERSPGHTALRIPAEHRSTYMACVHRGWEPTTFELYPLSIRDPLPKIRIPLRRGERGAVLDLQAIVALAYRNGRYALDIDYRAEPDPPLADDDARWAAGLLRERGRR